MTLRRSDIIRGCVLSECLIDSWIGCLCAITAPASRYIIATSVCMWSYSDWPIRVPNFDTHGTNRTPFRKITLYYSHKIERKRVRERKKKRNMPMQQYSSIGSNSILCRMTVSLRYGTIHFYCSHIFALTMAGFFRSFSRASRVRNALMLPSHRTHALARQAKTTSTNRKTRTNEYAKRRWRISKQLHDRKSHTFDRYKTDLITDISLINTITI